jgi:Kef-type K+ transport system membrane component KefB
MAILIPPSDTFLVDLFILLACAIAGGEIATRLGFVALVGQSIVGVILGPTLLGPYIGLGSTTLPPEIAGIQFLATFFIMFMAGLHVDPHAIVRMPTKTVMVGVGIFAIPFGVGAWVVSAVEPGLSTTTDLFVALTLAITALPVLGIMVAEFGLTGTRLGNLVMGASLVNELVAVTVFAILLQLTLSGRSDYYAVSVAILSVVLFLGGVLLASWGVSAIRKSAWWRAKPDRLGTLWRSREAGFAILMAIALGAALYSQLLGLTFLVGAFYAGLLISQAYSIAPAPRTFVSTFSEAGLLITQPSSSTTQYRAFDSIFTTMNWMFFIPLFFALVGVEMDLHDLGGLAALGAFVVLLVMALVTKLGTGAGLTRALGLSAPDSVASGFLLSSRGAIGLAMAVLLLADGVFSPALFTTVALIGLVTTIVSPLGALAAWRSTPASRAELEQRMPSLRQGRPLRLSAAIDEPPAPPTGPSLSPRPLPEAPSGETAEPSLRPDSENPK